MYGLEFVFCDGRKCCYHVVTNAHGGCLSMGEVLERVSDNAFTPPRRERETERELEELLPYIEVPVGRVENL